MTHNHRIPPPLSLPFLPHRRRQRRCGCAFANRTNTTAYDYDFLGQLVGADYSNTTPDETYTYDANGNRVTANGDDYTTGDNNELTSDGSYTYTYDAEGNRISKTNATNRELYEWDYRNRLTKVTQQTYDTETSTWTTTQIVEYAYDYNNVWVRKLIGNNSTIFIPENYQTVLQLDDTNLTDQSGPTATHHYLWTPQTQDKLLADTTPAGTLWTLTDHLGTIRDIIQQTPSGLITPAHLIYDAYGNLISGTNPLLFGYTGKAYDPSTQLQNNINRWYDAAVGRWLSADPIGFEGNDANLYRYVGNHIIQYNDKMGLKACSLDEIPKRRDVKVTRIWFQYDKPDSFLDLLTVPWKAGILELFQSCGGIATGSIRAAGNVANILADVVNEVPSVPGHAATIGGLKTRPNASQTPSNNAQNIPIGYDKKWLDGITPYFNAIIGFNVWFQMEYKICECHWLWGNHYVTHRELYLASNEWANKDIFKNASKPTIKQLQKMIDKAIEKYSKDALVK